MNSLGNTKQVNQKQNRKISWQAHRGGGANEAPDNTLAANRYAWGLGGIPESDLRATADGVIVCLHDPTPARTTTAPDEVKDRPITSFHYEEVRQWDAGVKFAAEYRDQKIPTIEEIFVEMNGHPERLVYLDLKDIDLKKLGQLIDIYQVNRQVIFAHNIQDSCIKMKEIAKGVRTMQWIGGKPDQIKAKFAQTLQSNFQGLDQVQIHLNPNAGPQSDGWLYEIDSEFLNYALRITGQYGIDLEVLPYVFDDDAIGRLLDMGIDWYATDEPRRFLECLNQWKSRQE